MTVYDGFLSMLFQPIIGSIISITSIIAIGIIGSPLLVPSLWSIWKRAWIAPSVVLVVSFICLYMSWMPQYQEMVQNSDTGVLISTFNTSLALWGWSLMIFGVLWNPKIGLVGDKKWI